MREIEQCCFFPTMEVNGSPKQPDYKLSSEHLSLCSEQTHSYRFGATRGWVNNDRIVLVNCPFNVFNAFRAFRGKHITLVVRFPNQGRQVDDLDIWSHTNDTIGSVRRCILARIKANSTHTQVELLIGGETVDPLTTAGWLDSSTSKIRLWALQITVHQHDTVPTHLRVWRHGSVQREKK